jgi:hypothetical protein
MMSAPAIWSSRRRCSASVEPIPVAVMPSATKMTVKERQKMTAGQRMRPTGRSGPRISSMLTPDTDER